MADQLTLHFDPGGVACPHCQCPESSVCETRKWHYSTLRRRICKSCKKTFLTLEEVVKNESPVYRAVNAYNREKYKRSRGSGQD